MYVAEVPSHDWRCQISNDTALDLKQQYEMQAEQIITGIVNDQVERITEVMESISHCCGVIETQDEKTGEVKTKKRKIYDTTIEKAKELCDTFKKFKPIDNELSSKLSEVVVKLENALNGVDTKSIRESDAIRDRVKSEVDDILSKFKF